MTPFDKLPDAAFIRQSQLVPNANPAKREGQTPLIKMSPSTLWRMVARGEFPAPLKLGANITAWRVGEVRAWLAAQGTQLTGNGATK
jgi:prophage regulatory protein